MSIKKSLIAVVGAALIAPALALAANDVTLTTSAIVKVGTAEIDISGSSATIDSITVGSSNMTVTVESGSSITMTSGVSLTTTTSGNVVVTPSCSGGTQTVKVTPVVSSAVTVTVTPGSSACSASSSSSSSSGGGNGPLIALSSGGGGGGAIVPLAAASTSASTSAPLSPAPSKASLIAALQAQIDVLLAKIAALAGGANSSAGTVFSRSLTMGSVGSDVRMLQRWLNAHGFIVAKKGPGSPGNETRKFGILTKKALARWQSSVGITPARGFFGPKSRAYLVAHR